MFIHTGGGMALSARVEELVAANAISNVVKPMVSSKM